MMSNTSDPRPIRPGRLLLWLLVCFWSTGCSNFQPTIRQSDKEIPSASPSASLPGKYSVRRSQYVFYSDFALTKSTPLLDELSDLRDQVYKELQLPASNTVVQVFLFEDEERYVRYMKARYPDLPKRRAFFIAQPHSRGGADDLLVYTFWGDHIRQDLRHELTHALLHSVLKDVPLWLDEGLAEYYELPPEKNGVNTQHLDQLRRGPLQVDLARLEQLSQVQHMERAEYREAWAWVHMMMHGKPGGRKVLLEYLQLMRGTTPPGQLLPKLQDVYPNPGDALNEYLAQLDAAQFNTRASADRR